MVQTNQSVTVRCEMKNRYQLLPTVRHQFVGVKMNWNLQGDDKNNVTVLGK